MKKFDFLTNIFFLTVGIVIGGTCAGDIGSGVGGYVGLLIAEYASQKTKKV